MARPFRRFVLPVVVALLAACASTSLRDSWSSPDFRGGAFKKWLVVGVAPSAVDRRVFEDIMVQKIAARGAQAVQGYLFLPDGQASEAQLDAAVARSGADALMLTRVRGVDTRTQVSTTFVPSRGFGPGFWGMYSGWVAVPDVRQYELAHVETSVFDVATRQLVWTGLTETFNPSTVRQEVPGFADVILNALAQRGMIGPVK